MHYQKINNLIGWLCAILATLVYGYTADPYTSWWDTGEFIASAYRLQIVHQPGAPLFLMIQNVFSNLALSDPTKIAYAMNIGSAVCSGLTILFLFWTVTALTRKVLGRQETVEGNRWQTAKVMLAGVIGAMAYCFTDSFWYSAVESEVYAMSSLCTAAVFWLILKWERRADEQDAARWLILIAYIMGLSIGVHLLNLLTIPALALVIYFRKQEKITLLGAAKALAIGIAVLAGILWGIIQYTVRAAAITDVFFVNQLGLGFGSGVIFFTLLVIALLAWGIYYSIKRHKPILNIGLLATSFVLFGYMSYAMLVIRAHADPSLNNNAPDNVYSFLGYVAREQYSSEPLFKGPTFDAKVNQVKPTESYKKGATKYEKIAGRSSYSFDKEMLFPRIYSDKHADFYRYYLNLSPTESPTFSDNVKFFLNYQLNNMYTRYFLWNFVGRQNDETNYVDARKGNWLTGIKQLDHTALDNPSQLPTSMQTNPSRNVYYALPLLLGLIGLFWHVRNDKRSATIVALLFFFTGIAIVLYLNQSPMQPRERDYAYAGSFYAFAIWIGLGAIGITEFFQRKLHHKAALLSAGLLCLFAGPLLLLRENWDDHDRSSRSVARDVAYNYLMSCEPNALLFTYADNDTFPLWYMQEVEGVRTDVRIINLSYLQSHWYVRQLNNQVNAAAPVKLGFDSDKMREGVRDYLPFVDRGISNPVDLDTLIAFLTSDNPKNQVEMQNGEMFNYLPAKRIEMPVDKKAALASNTIPQQWHNAIVDKMEWDYPSQYMTRAELSLMAIILENNWKRPIYFTNYLPSQSLIGLDNYIVDEGLVKKLLPIAFSEEQHAGTIVHTEKLYQHITQDFKWGAYNKVNHLDVDSRRYLEGFVYPDIYVRASSLLKEEGEMEKAREVAIKSLALLPKRAYSINEAYYYSDIVDTLYKTKEVSLANELTKRNLNLIQDELHYTESLARDKPELLDVRSIKFALSTLELYDRILSQTDDKAMYANVNKVYLHYKEKYGIK
ncbi:glycosyltransferase family 117 protein [Sphingobacterium sp. MYb382]|uniref:glycosyltransferase family 117 protein n=1 Tax=Sphingobacterium sp. MYb382 TaxID=2745278 RepID=UPI0030B62F54